MDDYDMCDEAMERITKELNMMMAFDIDELATKIQSVFRGFLVRRRMNMIEELFEYDDEEQRYQNYRLDCQMDCRD